MNLPENLLYLESHEWVKIEGDEALIGITDFAQEQLGDVTFAELPAKGAKLTAGKEMGSIESVKAASEIYAPVTGVVLDVNGKLDDSPELINKSPYGEGWLLRVSVEGKSDKLLSAAEYAKRAH